MRLAKRLVVGISLSVIGCEPREQQCVESISFVKAGDAIVPYTKSCPFGAELRILLINNTSAAFQCICSSKDGGR